MRILTAVMTLLATSALAQDIRDPALITKLAAGVLCAPEVTGTVPAPDTVVQAWPSAPRLISGRAAIEPSRRPATQAALAEWRKYVFFRDTAITRRMRVLLARWVAMWLGDGTISPPTEGTASAAFFSRLSSAWTSRLRLPSTGGSEGS